MPGFIADHNVGKLARWLRMLGFDSLFFTGKDDAEMVDIALRKNYIIVSVNAPYAIVNIGTALTGRL